MLYCVRTSTKNTLYDEKTVMCCQKVLYATELLPERLPKFSTWRPVCHIVVEGHNWEKSSNHLTRWVSVGNRFTRDEVHAAGREYHLDRGYADRVIRHEIGGSDRDDRSYRKGDKERHVGLTGGVKSTVLYRDRDNVGSDGRIYRDERSGREVGPHFSRRSEQDGR